MQFALYLSNVALQRAHRIPELAALGHELVKTFPVDGIFTSMQVGAKLSSNVGQRHPLIA